MGGCFSVSGGDGGAVHLYDRLLPEMGEGRAGEDATVSLTLVHAASPSHGKVPELPRVPLEVPLAPHGPDPAPQGTADFANHTQPAEAPVRMLWGREERGGKDLQAPGRSALTK